MESHHPVYMDCNASTPCELEVSRAVTHFLEIEIGNPGSRTHELGSAAKKAIRKAREQVARVVDAQPDEVIFTSGATESNNLALLGLRSAACTSGRKHIVSTRIEHKAVLEPLQRLEDQGFQITLVPPESNGIVLAEHILEAIQPDTFLISMMHVNNETGIVQPVEEVCQGLADQDVWFHVDAAQGFGKLIKPLRNRRIDLISISGHKIYGPMGIGALIARKRGYQRPPLEPLMVGGGQEWGIRPGTLPTPLIVGLGKAAEIAMRDQGKRAAANEKLGKRLRECLSPFDPIYNGSQEAMLPHVVNLSIPGVDSEAAMLALKGVIAISNGSACTSQSYEPSHVLEAMGLPEDQIAGALRISWCHMTEEPDWVAIADKVGNLR